MTEMLIEHFFGYVMAALENTDSLDSVEYSSSKSVTTKAVGEEETSYTKYRAKFSGLNGSNLKGSGTITSASKGKTGEMFIYRTADAEYVSVGDQKVKFPIYGEKGAYLPLPSVVEIIDGIEEMVDEAEVRRNSDGSIDLVVDMIVCFIRNAVFVKIGGCFNLHFRAGVYQFERLFGRQFR